MTHSTDATLNHLLTVALEGASGYWLNNDDAVRNVTFTRDRNHEVTALCMATNIDGCGWKKQVVTAVEVRKALEAMRADKRMPAPIRQFAADLLSDDRAAYDMADADVAVQYALFKDVVFG